MAERRLLSTEGQHQGKQPKYEALPGDVESESRSSNPAQAPYFPVRVVVYLAAYLIVGAVVAKEGLSKGMVAVGAMGGAPWAVESR